MEPELVEQPPKGGEWGHEVKFDGYRTQVIKDADGITKNGFDCHGQRS
jgi:ATP-dependent DNA ligase